MAVSIGVVFAAFESSTEDILSYLITFQNSIQNSFEFRLLSAPTPDPFISLLQRIVPPTHEEAEGEVDAFVARVKAHDASEAASYGLMAQPVDKIVLFSNTRFSDNFYYIGCPTWSVVALSGWQTEFAPPSIVEYYLSILVTSALDAVGAGIDRHFNTRGCIFDFNASLSDKRLSVLSGHICADCKMKIEKMAGSQVVADALVLLQRSWLGSAQQPSEVAFTVKKLGYDLFHTTGVRPTLKERLLTTFEQEGLKNALNITFQLLLAIALVIIGLKKQ